VATAASAAAPGKSSCSYALTASSVLTWLASSGFEMRTAALEASEYMPACKRAQQQASWLMVAAGYAATIGGIAALRSRLCC
jgi:hypothetical protein